MREGALKKTYSTDYLPVALTAYLNASLEVYQQARKGSISQLYSDQGSIPIGRQMFHGLPFQIGSEKLNDQPRFIAFNTG
jgi:hypothetical protein